MHADVDILYKAERKEGCYLVKMRCAFSRFLYRSHSKPIILGSIAVVRFFHSSAGLSIYDLLGFWRRCIALS
jgi:hypothetical protein